MTEQTGLSASADEAAVRELYRRLLDGWNERDATKFAAPFAVDGYVVGFDGSQMDGQREIAATIGQIFADHMTASYVGKIKAVRFLMAEVAILRAVAGLVPRGQSDLNPNTNAVQTLVAMKDDGAWRVALFQNTPAQFHGRLDLAERLTAELREFMRDGGRKTEDGGT
jgi:uncharacterized protein (TIGR02246 family)